MYVAVEAHLNIHLPIYRQSETPGHMCDENFLKHNFTMLAQEAWQALL